MAERTRKIIIFAIVIALFSICMLLQLNPAMQFNAAIGPTQCVFGNWESFDMPELAAEWQKKLKSVGLEATEISAEGVGEPLDCTAPALLGSIRSKIPPAAVNTDVYATIRVNNISDDTALGDIVTKIVMTLDPIKPYDSLDQANFHLKFAADQNKDINFDLFRVNKLLQQGLSSDQLIQALDGRYIPPTITPVPTQN